jgi:hypothetical protein
MPTKTTSANSDERNGMSYHEEDGQVTLTMSWEEFRVLEESLRAYLARLPFSKLPPHAAMRRGNLLFSDAERG